MRNIAFFYRCYNCRDLYEPEDVGFHSVIYDTGAFAIVTICEECWDVIMANIRRIE